MVIKAREGDIAAQNELKEFGLGWEFEPIVRFVGKSEVDSLLKGEKQQGKFKDGRVDVTKDIEGKDVPATTTDYRVRFKDSFDDKLDSGRRRITMKSERDGWVSGGYDINDVAIIEEKQPDGSWKEVSEVDAGEEEVERLEAVAKVQREKERLAREKAEEEKQKRIETIKKKEEERKKAADPEAIAQGIKQAMQPGKPTDTEAVKKKERSGAGS